MIVVIDYDAGNLYNVGNALKFLGVEHVLSGDPETVAGAEKVILPGVGSARAAMSSLQRQGLCDVIRDLRVPFLGICLGLQLLFEISDEEDCPCLGIIPGRVQRFDRRRMKVPHIGWNEVRWDLDAGPLVPKLVKGLSEEAYFYFVHSYYAPPVPEFTAAQSDYEIPFSAAVIRDNFLGVQFHPERSGMSGLTLLRNFIDAEGCKE